MDEQRATTIVVIAVRDGVAFLEAADGPVEVYIMDRDTPEVDPGDWFEYDGVEYAVGGENNGDGPSDEETALITALMAWWKEGRESEDKCRYCGEANDDGEGWDGYCSHCADLMQGHTDGDHEGEENDDDCPLCAGDETAIADWGDGK